MGDKVGFEDYFLKKLLLRELDSTFQESSDRSKNSPFFFLLRCYGRLQYGKIQRTNGIGTSELHAGGYERKKVQLEMKDSFKATTRDEKQLIKSKCFVSKLVN